MDSTDIAAPVAAGRDPAPAPGRRRHPARRAALWAAVLAASLLASGVIAVGVGTVPIPWHDTVHYLSAFLTGGTIDAADATRYRIVADTRLPRVLLAMVVGAGLSLVGVAVQAMVRNALADPFVLGISSGAAVGASSVILFGAFAVLGAAAVSFAAFAGALVATVLVYAAARTAQGLSPLRLVLTGTAMAYGFSAITTVMIFVSPRGEDAKSVMFWLLGSLAPAQWSSLPVVACVTAAGGLLLALWSTRLNALVMGDDVASGLGLDAARFRVHLFVVCAAMTGTIVAVVGAIGFVGLVVPHVTRMLVGADHRRVLLVAPLLAALFMVWADVFARVVVAPQELPIGAITAFVGVPLFVFLMRARRYVFGGA